MTYANQETGRRALRDGRMAKHERFVPARSPFSSISFRDPNEPLEESTSPMPATSANNQGKIRPLICFIGTLRALDITADSLKKHLIDPLDADVAVCIVGGGDACADDDAIDVAVEQQG